LTHPAAVCLAYQLARMLLQDASERVLAIGGDNDTRPEPRPE
jgi:hypothetical protein